MINPVPTKKCFGVYRKDFESFPKKTFDNNKKNKRRKI